MSQLLVTLPPPQAPQAEWAYGMLSSSGVLSAQGFAAPALLPRADVCTLIVPAQALSWHRVDLPKLPRGISAQKMQAVLAGALEEQLLDEPAALHMALITLPGSNASWVAVCQKAWLAEAIATLQQAGVQPSSLVPQAWPQQQEQIHVTGQGGDTAQLIVSHAHGVLCWPLAHATALSLETSSTLTAEPAVAAAAEQALQRRAQVLQASQAASESASQATALGLNLAQGEFTLSSSGRTLQSLVESLRNLTFAPAWRAARWGMAALLLAHLLGLNLWAWKQSHEVQAQRSQMQQILTSSFPNVKVVVDAPLQMQRELAHLRQSQGQLSGRDFESIYARFSAVAGMNAAPSAIEYEVDTVSLRGTDFSSAQLEALQPKLQYASLAVSSDTQRLIIKHSAQGAAQ